MIVLHKRFRTVNLATLRRQLRPHLISLQDDGPIAVVSTSGAQLGVILAPEAYDELVDKLEAALLQLEIREAEQQEGRSAAAGFRDFKERHGIDSA